MAGNTNARWNGPACKAMIERLVGQRLDAAAIYLNNQIKADISQSGTLRGAGATARDARGRFLKGSGKKGTIYNFTHSLPGNPPYKQTGHLRRSMMWERSGLVARVGTNLEYGRALELGTKHIAARPFILPAFIKHRGALESLIRGTMARGGLPDIESNQSRPGVLGSGAISAGFG